MYLGEKTQKSYSVTIATKIVNIFIYGKSEKKGDFQTSISPMTRVVELGCLHQWIESTPY